MKPMLLAAAMAALSASTANATGSSKAPDTSWMTCPQHVRAVYEGEVIDGSSAPGYLMSLQSSRVHVESIELSTVDGKKIPALAVVTQGEVGGCATHDGKVMTFDGGRNWNPSSYPAVFAVPLDAVSVTLVNGRMEIREVEGHAITGPAVLRVVYTTKTGDRLIDLQAFPAPTRY